MPPGFLCALFRSRIGHTMARFEVTGPDGSRYVVNAPDNATNEQVVAFAQGEAAKGAGRSPNYFDQFDPPDRGG
jgi:hypothetical protein